MPYISNSSFLLLLISASIWPAFFFYMPDEVRFEREGEEVQQNEAVNLMFVGDLLLDRSIRTYLKKEGAAYLFTCLEGTLKSMDAVVANLEGPITSYPSVSQGAAIGTPENTRFTMPPETGDILARYNISVVNLGNNHITDFGPEGIESTRATLESSGVAYFGDPLSTTTRARLAEFDNQKFAFVNYNDWSGSAQATLEQIEQYANEYPVIVYTHWGEEYVPASERLKALAHDFADAGADIVIGSHPHVVLESEIYELRSGQRVPIYYSLGNFIFDQYWNDEVSRGLALEVVFERGEIVGLEEYELDIQQSRQTCFVE